MRRRSFALIELVVAIGVFAAIGLLLIIFVKNGYNIYLRGQISSTLTSESQDLTTRVANGLRSTFDILAASGTAVTAQTYFAPNDTTPTQVTITQAGASVTLSRIQGVLQNNGSYIYDAATATTKTIDTHFVANPTTPLFRYYDQSNTLLVAPIDIKNVHLIEVTATVYAVVDPTKTFTGTTRIELRNLKTNL